MNCYDCANCKQDRDGRHYCELTGRDIKKEEANENCLNYESKPLKEKEVNEYHKIKTVYNRDPETNHKTLLLGEYATPELDYLSKNLWEFTEKVDGTNIRIIWDGEGKIRFGGKTDNSQIPSFLYDKLMDSFNPKQLLPVLDGPVTLYGEGYGAKIQKGGGNYKSDGVDFVLFDVRIGEWWLKRADVFDIGEKLGIAVVPQIGIGTLDDMVNMAREGFLSIWGNFQAEGIVARPTVELVGRNGHRVITKIKHKDFGKQADKI